ncbi:DUF418 domain-containing protein [Nocardia brasiliensis]|uniref:Membrane spanning protein n=1 Tax=Nocardia brasiliensis (strain ATCC 700358 / HUJEG-1) TaxID=1133849 RepID=K0EIZ7_NOCB7|nr:DUF418 domain-containing protein [Nocardia brasiliensis]AFT99307.1 membrane spanning protein [Nocardia brasiliensis ATCC 700358]OCF90289.1 hypothetical protein AW168_09840 [Nocardia brasiliensis]
MHNDPGRLRIHELDAVRGFALCGILVVNIWQLTDMTAVKAPGEMVPLRHVLSILFEGRFFPIFSFLFGLSFALFLDSAAARTDRPRLVLIRRLLALGVLGFLHHQCQPGEALLPYAIVGLIILLPAASLPDWLVLLLGLVAVGVAVALGGGFGLVPGLFLLGLATARYGVADTLDERGGQLAVAFALALPAAVAAAVWEFRIPYLDLLASNIPSVAGLFGALAYLTGLLLVLRTEIGEVVSEVLEPLGRMALTNYVSATALVLLIAPRIGLTGSNRYALLLGLAVAIIAVQAVFSWGWLKLFRYGPLEWLWRCVTWWELVPARRVPEPSRRW